MRDLDGSQDTPKGKCGCTEKNGKAEADGVRTAFAKTAEACSIIEISDADYRSIFWPCDPLLENSDDKTLR